jgi:predicted esterase
MRYPRTVDRTRLHTLTPLLVLLATACGDDADEPGSPSDPAPAPDAGAGADATPSPDTDAPAPDPEPPAPQPPAPPAYSGGACPTLQQGTNTIDVAGASRRFELWLPENPEGAPLLFLWHGAGDSASAFGPNFGAGAIARDRGAIIAVPYASEPALLFSWSILSTDDRDLDLVFFDDMLSCIDAQFAIDRGAVYTTGFSAGALWSTWLLISRAEHLAAVTLFSGGVSNFTFEYETPGRTVPALLIHGGVEDQVFVRFDEAQEALSEGLSDDGHVVFLCDHGGGHTVPGAMYTIGLEFLFGIRWDAIPDRFAGAVPEGWPRTCERR